MVSTASRIRTSLAIGVGLGTIIAALASSPRSTNSQRPTDRTDRADDEISVHANLATSQVLPDPQDQHVVVTIAAPDPPADATRVRPPLSLAIVIDRSCSLQGAAIENARAAALAMVRQLDDRDAFAVVIYSRQSQPVLAMQRATSAAKTWARTAIEGIDTEGDAEGDTVGGTCISCGLEAGADELARTPIRDGLRRLLGVVSRDALAQLAALMAARGVSISTLGVGLFDEGTMRELAELGRGNYYVARDDVAVSQLFMHELATLRQPVASEVRLSTAPGPGVRIEEVYGYPMSRDGDRVIVAIGDLLAGETRKVVFRVALAAAPPGATRAISQIDVAWRGRSDASLRVAHATAEIDVTSAAADVAASGDPETARAIVRALSARALGPAAAAYDARGLSSGREVGE